MHLYRRFRLWLLGCALPLLLLGCATGGAGNQDAAPPLRIGVTPNYPPIIFREGNEIMGLEADFARALGRRLERPVRFVPMEWGRLIPAVEGDEIDLIMSGMSITEMRSLRVAFAEPYLMVGQMILVRGEDLDRYRYPQVIQTSAARIGVMEGSTGDLFVQRRCPRAQRVLFATPEQAVNALRRGRIDVVLDDAPTIWRFAALHESDGLVGRFTPLTEEYLSWAGSRSNPGLLSQVNQTLTGWRDSGELDRILDRWLPSSQP